MIAHILTRMSAILPHLQQFSEHLAEHLAVTLVVRTRTSLPVPNDTLGVPRLQDIMWKESERRMGDGDQDSRCLRCNGAA